MSNVRYNAGTMTIEVDGLDDVSAVLGDLRKKTPAVAKVAINATDRKLMIAEAKARYAVNSAGKRHLSDLVQRKKASNSSLSAELRIASYRNDLGYFQTRPNRPFMGHDVAQAPEYFTARVLKTSPMKALTGKGRLSKGMWAWCSASWARGASTTPCAPAHRAPATSCRPWAAPARRRCTRPSGRKWSRRWSCSWRQS
mgnify:CR=1 FL=1